MRNLSETETVCCVTQDFEDALAVEVEDMFSIYQTELTDAASDGIPDDVYNAIVLWLNEQNNYYLYRHVLCALDNKQTIGLERAISVDNHTGFNSLNDNIKQTGLLILPKVSGAKTTYVNDTKPIRTLDDLPVRKTANDLIDDINARLNNVYYVLKDELGVYTLRNYVYNPPYMNQQQTSLTIGVSPILNGTLEDVLVYDDNVRENNPAGTEYLYLDIHSVKCPDEILRRIQKCHEIACKHNVDILMFPEMLGIPDLYKLDHIGYNTFLRQLNRASSGTVPKLVIAPSLWEKGSNRVNVYSSSAKLLCNQYKQFPYTHKGRYGKCTEHLLNIPRVINIIHIPGWGRIAIPICFDFLQAKYRHSLVELLKINILLCPSCSMGEYNFLGSIDADSEYGAYSIWLNTCAALDKASNGVAEIVGAVSVPTVSTDSRITRLCPRCAGACENGCLFIISLPLNCMGSSTYEGSTATVDHIFK